MYRFRSWLMLWGDAALMYGALALMLWIRGGEAMFSQFFTVYFVPFSILNILWILVFFIFNLYSPYKLRSRFDFVQAFVTSMIVNGLGTIVFFYLVSGIFGISPKTNLALYVVIFSVLFILWRMSVGPILKGAGVKKTVVFFGMDERAKRLSRRQLNGHDDHYRVAASVDEADPDLLDWMIKKHNAQVVIAGHEHYRNKDMGLHRYVLKGVAVLDASSFLEQVHRSIFVDVADSTWILSGFQGVDKREFEIFKRVFDAALSFILLILTAAPCAVIVILVKATGQGPAVYVQRRVGKNGREFNLYKFRTMVSDAEKNGAQWAVKNDPRVTPVGRVLRHSHLDELPQLVNILRGDMSFSGPRPERPEIEERINDIIPFYEIRHLVRPGITGWAQVNYAYGASVEDAKVKLCYDLYYIKHRNAFFDAKILLKTAAMLLRGEGR